MCLKQLQRRDGMRDGTYQEAIVFILGELDQLFDEIVQVIHETDNYRIYTGLLETLVYSRRFRAFPVYLYALKNTRAEWYIYKWELVDEIKSLLNRLDTKESRRLMYVIETTNFDIEKHPAEFTQMLDDYLVMPQIEAKIQEELHRVEE